MSKDSPLLSPFSLNESLALKFKKCFKIICELSNFLR